MNVNDDRRRVRPARRAMTRTAALFVAGGFCLGSLVFAPRISYAQSRVTVGEYADFSCGQVGAFENWLGVTPGSTYSLIYSPGGNYPSGGGYPSLGAIESALQANQCGYGAYRPQEVSVAVNDTPWAILGGTYDQYFANLGTALAAYAPNAVVRWDWEFNGAWTYFYIGGGAGGYAPWSYASVMQYAVSHIRAYAPSIKIEWTPGACLFACYPDPVAAYPGDAYVDIIGLDIYDQFDWGNAWSDWANLWVGNTSTRALAWQVSFAQQHGKAVSLGEWGVGCGGEWQTGWSCNGASLDDPHGAVIVQNMAAWLKNTNNVNGYQPYAYFDYWNTNEAYCGVLDGGAGEPCAGGGAPWSAAPTPPSSNWWAYQLPLSAQAFYTAFSQWQ